MDFCIWMMDRSSLKHVPQTKSVKHKDNLQIMRSEQEQNQKQKKTNLYPLSEASNKIHYPDLPSWTLLVGKQSEGNNHSLKEFEDCRVQQTKMSAVVSFNIWWHSVAGRNPAPVDVVVLSCYLQGVKYMSGGWPWDFSIIAAILLGLNFWTSATLRCQNDRLNIELVGLGLGENPLNMSWNHCETSWIN